MRRFTRLTTGFSKKVRTKSSSVIVPPIPVRVCSKVVVEVAWLIRNLGSCPTRQLDLIVGIRNFDFGDDRPVVIPVKNVDLQVRPAETSRC